MCPNFATCLSHAVCILGKVENLKINTARAMCLFHYERPCRWKLPEAKIFTRSHSHALRAVRSDAERAFHIGHET